jgi:RHS repeat-associated protein
MSYSHTFVQFLQDHGLIATADSPRLSQPTRENSASTRDSASTPVQKAYSSRNRWYSPTLETWTQQDPAGYFDGANLYQSVGSNPSSLIDPSGLLKGSANFPTGTLQWQLIPSPNGSSVGATITFTPNQGACNCRDISFVQVIHQNSVDGVTHYGPGSDLHLDYWDQLTTDGGSWVDHLHIPEFGAGGDEKDPFYGAQQLRNGIWVTEGLRNGNHLGHGDPGQWPPSSAQMTDKPTSSPWTVNVLRVETFAVCIETGQILGGVNWGYDYDPAHGTTLWGGEQGTATPSQEWADAIEQWNSVFGKYPFHPLRPPGGYAPAKSASN